MCLKSKGRLAFSVIKFLLMIGGVESNPGPKCTVSSHSEEEKYTAGTISHQDIGQHEVQHLRKRVNELEMQVVAANVLRVTELAHQKQDYEQRLHQQRAGGLLRGEWAGTAGRLRELLPKDRLRLFIYFVLVAVIIFILLKTGHKHHNHGHRFFWGKRH